MLEVRASVTHDDRLGHTDALKHLRLEPFGIEVRSAAEFDLPEPEETETTFVGNARIKAHAAARATGLPALADDSGIEVDALERAPGVYTADWAETGAGRDFVMAMERAHRELVQRQAPQPWRARFRATMVLLHPDGTEAVFEGDMPGQLVWPIRGKDGFGYDPMFVPEGFDITFAEMDRWEKNKISHRGRAVEMFVKGCFGG